MAAFVPATPTLRGKTPPPLSWRTALSTSALPGPSSCAAAPHVVSPSRRAAAPTRTETRCSDMGLTFPTTKADETFRIGVIVTRWNAPYVSALKKSVLDTLHASNISEDNIVLMEVAGAFELPIAARLMAAAQKVDAIISIGVLIKGGSLHFEYISSAVTSGLMDVQLASMVPCIFGVLTCLTDEQAHERSISDGSHAEDWAKTAIEMASLRKSQMGGVSAGKKSVGFF